MSQEYAELFDSRLFYARLSREIIQNLTDQRKESVIFNKYTREQVIDFLSNPQRYEKQIRDVSIFLYANSGHYRRLCNNYSKLPTYNYIISPYNINPSKYNKDNFLFNYYKVCSMVEKFNFKYHLQNIFNICMYQDVYYGVYTETEDSFSIQQINPNYCSIIGREDTCILYNLDFNYFRTREYLLNTFGEDFRQMYLDYVGYTITQSDGSTKEIKGNPKLRWQTPPRQICFKVNDDQLNYCLPPFAGVFPEILNLEDYKLLRKAEEMLDHYKLLYLELELNENGGFKIPEPMADKYYRQLCDNIDKKIAIGMGPMKLDKVDFNNTRTTESNAVSDAEDLVYGAAGSSKFLYGSSSTATSAILDLSVRNDESISFFLLRQAENWINRYIKLKNLPYEYKIQFLNQSIYNEQDVVNRYEKAISHGTSGSFSLYSSALGISPSCSLGLGELEKCLDVVNKWVPAKSSNTIASDEGGRPTNASQGKSVTDKTETGQDNNANNEN